MVSTHNILHVTAIILTIIIPLCTLRADTSKIPNITVKLQWLNHLWNNENSSRQGQFELVSVHHGARSGGIIRFSLTWIKVFSVFALESPHTIYHFQYIKKITLIIPYGIFPRDLKDEFEAAIVKESSLFEPLNFYCIILKGSRALVENI